jgi:hypothetical protein
MCDFNVLNRRSPMEEKQTLYIPQGLKTRYELFDGYGKEELLQTIIDRKPDGLALWMNADIF